MPPTARWSLVATLSGNSLRSPCRRSCSVRSRFVNWRTTDTCGKRSGAAAQTVSARHARLTAANSYLPDADVAFIDEIFKARDLFCQAQLQRRLNLLRVGKLEHLECAADSAQRACI